MAGGKWPADATARHRDDSARPALNTASRNAANRINRGTRRIANELSDHVTHSFLDQWGHQSVDGGLAAHLSDAGYSRSREAAGITAIGYSSV